MRMRSMLIAVCLAALTAGCVKTTVAAPPSASKETTGLTVTGLGKVVATPDMLVVAMGVSVVDARPQDALRRASIAARRLTTAIKARHVEAKDIMTESLNLNPQYSRRGRISRYEAQEMFSIRIRDLTKAGEIVGAAVGAAGSTARIDGMSLQVSDPEAKTDQGRTDAIADARARAETLARGSGVKLGAPLSIDEASVPNFRPLNFYGGFGRFGVPGGTVPAAKYAQLAPAIEAGSQEITVAVKVRFALAP